MNPQRMPLRRPMPYGLRSVSLPADRSFAADRLVFIGIHREPPPPVVYFGADHFALMRAAILGGIPAASYAEPAPLPAIDGEVLQDQDANCYQRVGNGFRPLPALPPAGDVEEEQAPPRPSNRRRRRAVSRTEHASEETRAIPPATPLLPPDGRRQAVPFAGFRRLLAGQIAHPERLNETHHLRCVLQVYETRAPMAPAALASVIYGDRQPEGEFCVLSRALAERLRLTEVVPPPATQGAPRYLHIRVEHDPTAAAPAPYPKSDAGESAPKTAIPERYMKPWEFRYTREEAVYDMNQDRAPGFMAPVVSFFRRLGGGGAEIRKWRALLQGKPAEDQLWAVRPPASALGDGRVRQWIGEMLAACGYQPETMLAEWEIYWRRKGL